MLRITPYETVGRYRLLGELGQGGTATVSLAVASGPAGFSKLVVLKKMKPQFSSEPGFAEMFLTEARLAARLNHPNIVQTNEVFEHEGLPVLVMEYLEGRSFADIFASRTPAGPFQLGHCLTVISEALSGLHYSHEATDLSGRSLELVHRDMTPHNVFVTHAGQVKILDFGIAKLKDSSVNTETGVVKGKLRYIPPEQIVGEQLDRRADIYAVGVMLWEVATGEKLWRGLSDAAVMNRVINEKIPRPSEKNPRIPLALERVIMRALAPHPEARHPSALHLQQEVDELRRSIADASVRDLVPAMGALFGEERARTRKLVDLRLTQLALGAEETSGSPTSPTLKAFSTNEVPRRADPRMSRAPWGWVGAGVLLLGGLSYWGATANVPSEQPVGIEPALLTDRGERSSAAAPRALQSAAQQEQSPTDSVQPLPSEQQSSGAQVPASRLAPTQPTAADRGKSAEASTSSGARGSLPASRAQLQKSFSAEAPSVESSPKVQASSPACQPPFVVDSRGVKRFKRECVR